MLSRRHFSFGILAICTATPALAQFTGPSETAAGSSVARALSAQTGTYVTIEGHLLAHLGEEYYRFSDGADEIRVEIPDELFAGRAVSPETRIRIRAEVDRGITGRYLWVEALDLL